MKKLLVGTALFVLVSFASQSISHFGINAEHYGTIPFMRKEPVFALGVAAMLLQGLVLSHLFQRLGAGAFSARNGARFGLLVAALFVSYPALVEPAKYMVPSVLAWMLVEGAVGVVQFTLYGIALAFAFNKMKQ